MMRIILDTNVLISAILSPKGLSAQVFRYEREDKIELAFSPATIEEAWRVLGSVRIQALLQKRGISSDKAKTFFESILKSSFLTPGILTVKAVSEDPDDDKFLACALEANADFIVSDDAHLCKLKSFHGVHIVDSFMFLKVMERLHP
ncbi:MAG: putative toxin-antitoxin system toxin component, PIN family [Syntrophobacteraceae bacterium]